MLGQWEWVRWVLGVTGDKGWGAGTEWGKWEEGSVSPHPDHIRKQRKVKSCREAEETLEWEQE